MGVNVHERVGPAAEVEVVAQPLGAAVTVTIVVVTAVLGKGRGRGGDDEGSEDGEEPPGFPAGEEGLLMSGAGRLE